MTAVYLYSYGRRRHIQESIVFERRTFCGVYAATDEQMAKEQRAWSTAKVAARRIAKARALPVCKICERSHEKQATR